MEGEVTDAERITKLEAKLAEAQADVLRERRAGEARSETTRRLLAESEAKNARVVEALIALREESKAMSIPEAIPEAHKERMLVLRARIADVTALASAREQPTQEEP